MGLDAWRILRKGWHTETFGHLFNDAWNQYYRITNPLVGRPLFQDAGVSISYSDLAKHILAIDKFLIDYPKFPLIYRQTKNSENIKINWEDIHTLDLDKRFSAFFEFFLQSYDNSRVFISDHENKRYYLPKDGRYTNSQTVMMNLFSKVQNKSLKKTLMDFYAYLEANDFKFNWGTVRGTVNNEIDQFFQGYEPFILNYDVPSRARDIQTVKKDELISYLSNDKISIKDIPRAYWADRDFVSKVIKHDGVAIRFASERIRSDATFCAPLLDKNPYLLSYLSDTLKSNRDIVLVAVKRNGYVLQFVSKPLRNDADIVREAVKDSTSSFEYASNEIRNNEAFVLALLDEVQSSYDRQQMLRYISNLNILVKVIKKDPHGLNSLSNEFRNNRDLALVALSQNGSVLKNLSSELKDDKELVLATLNAENYSVTYKRELLSYASRRLQNDASLLRELD